MLRIIIVFLCVCGYICGNAVLSAAGAETASVSTEKFLENSDSLQSNDIEYGQWLPVRTQPTQSTLTSQHSTYVSPSNAAAVRKMIAGFMDKQPMLLVRGKFGRVVIGKNDGLIHGMRPRILSETFQGSYLREYASGWKGSGNLKIVSQTPQEIILEWKGENSSRSISVTNDGVIKTIWKNGPKVLSVFTGAHPYNYLATGPKNVVRFSQLLQMKRPLQGFSSFAFWGYRGAALEIKADGIKSDSEEIWLDSGEMGWEFVNDYLKKYAKPADKLGDAITQRFSEWMRRNAALTYLGGGAIRNMAFTAVGNDYSIDYRISCDGSAVLARIRDRHFNSTKTLPQNQGDVTVTALMRKLDTVRIWPNNFNGWELRPLKLVHINPMPRFYQLTLSNNTASPLTFEFNMSHGDWIASADVESDPVEFKINNGNGAMATIPEYVIQNFWKASAKPRVTVSARSVKDVLLKIQPIEESVGKFDFSLDWKAGEKSGSIPLCLKVIPSYMVAPTYYHVLKGLEDRRLFSYTGGQDYVPRPPYYSWMTSPDVSSVAVQDEYLQLAGMEYMRNGGWVRDNANIREYITAQAEKIKLPPKHPFGMKPDDFVKQCRKDIFMRKARFPYRYRMYMADEIWEILGGYKGRRYMPIPQAAKLVGDLIRNCPTACWFSFMQPGVDAGYPMLLPNDLPETFYYCGRDEEVRLYIQKLLMQRSQMVTKWKKNPEFVKQGSRAKVVSMCSFAISAQLHVTDYDSMRRQGWYAAYSGVNILLCYALRDNFMLYSNNVGCNSLLSVGNREIIMTDRSLAWYDLREDMQWFGLVNMLKAKAGPQVRNKVTALQRDAFLASQRNDFDAARDMMVQAVKLMAPEYANLPDEHFYTPVKGAVALPDMFENDRKLLENPNRRFATVHKLKGGFRPAPALDGQLDNSYLEEGVNLGNFTLLNSHKAPKETTDAYVAWDDKNLYVLFLCNENDVSKITADSKLKRDDKVYDTDCVELLINRDSKSTTYMQFIVGAGGTIYDSKDGSASWNPQWEWKVAGGKGLWSAEMIIPMSVLGGKPKDGEVWRINVARERVEGTERSTWSPQSNAIDDPTQFGELKFMDK